MPPVPGAVSLLSHMTLARPARVCFNPRAFAERMRRMASPGRKLREPIPAPGILMFDGVAARSAPRNDKTPLLAMTKKLSLRAKRGNLVQKSGIMKGPGMSDATHRGLIRDQFTRQATPFSTAAPIADAGALRMIGAAVLN